MTFGAALTYDMILLLDSTEREVEYRLKSYATTLPQPSAALTPLSWRRNNDIRLNRANNKDQHHKPGLHQPPSEPPIYATPSPTVNIARRYAKYRHSSRITITLPTVRNPLSLLSEFHQPWWTAIYRRLYRACDETATVTPHYLNTPSWCLRHTVTPSRQARTTHLMSLILPTIPSSEFGQRRGLHRCVPVTRSPLLGKRVRPI